MISTSDREWLANHVTYTDEVSQRADLLDARYTQDNLIQALTHTVKQGHGVLITCVNRDHSNDSALGPHGHTGGYSVDCWPHDESKLAEFVQAACTSNPLVIKVGLGGKAQHLKPNPGGTVVFDDNSTDHIHFEAGG